VGNTSTNLTGNYSLQNIDNQHHLHVLRMQAAQSMLEHSNDEMSPIQGSKMHQSARKTKKAMEQSGYETFRNDINKGQ
jgi:hypothetical protein